MSQIETSTTVKSFPEGGKIVRSEALGPVMITRVRTVGMDQQTLEVQLEQKFAPPVGSQGGLLALTMAGHTSFNNGPRKRFTWQNFSTQQAVAFGIVRSWEEVAESEGVLRVGEAPRKGILTFPNDGKKLVFVINGKELETKIIEVETFMGRKWIDGSGKPQEQRPKQAGPEATADLLTYNGKSIYRNSGLSISGMDDIYTTKVDGKDVQLTRRWDEDLVILHNNRVIGSSVKQNAAKAGIALPSVPGAHNPGYQGDPTRIGPEGQTEQVAGKTEAELQREAGLRDVHAGQQ